MASSSSIGDPYYDVKLQANTSWGTASDSDKYSDLRELTINNADAFTITTGNANVPYYQYSAPASELMKVLNTLFSGRIIVYHDNLITNAKTRILSKEEATQYIESCFPQQFVGVVFDGTGCFMEGSPFTPQTLLAYYEAKDGASHFEIRFPQNNEEKAYAIEKIKQITVTAQVTITSGYASTTTTTNITPSTINTTPYIYKSNPQSQQIGKLGGYTYPTLSTQIPQVGNTTYCSNSTA